MWGLLVTAKSSDFLSKLILNIIIELTEDMSTFWFSTDLIFVIY